MSQVIDRFRSSTWGWLRGTLAGWGTLLLGVAGFLLAVWARAGGPLESRPTLPLLLSLAALVIVLVKWVANLAVTYELTDDRLILHKGILAKSIDEIELYRVKDVRIDFTIVNQLADIGTITIASSDETTRLAPLAIRDIVHARARREKLRELVDAVRRQRGVREIDMVHENIGEP